MPDKPDPIDFLNAFHPLSDQLKDRLNSILKKDTFKKKTILLKEGQVCNHIYFIEEGLVRVYYLKDGVEICSGLLCEDGVLISVKSFFNRVPSDEYIQVLEDLTAYYISHQELEDIYRDFPEFNSDRQKIDHCLLCTERRAKLPVETANGPGKDPVTFSIFDIWLRAFRERILLLILA